MKAYNNLRDWKTSILGILVFVGAYFYLTENQSPEFFIVITLLIVGLMLIFSPDSLIKSVSNFLKKNDSKEL